MGFQIRQATVDDVEVIAQVKDSVWPEADVNLDMMRIVVADSGHRTLVAEADGLIVGFVDGFQTISLEGLRRWELDLIAVHPDFQKRGIAAELMRMNTQYGREIGSNLARGLVEIENVGSQRTFSRCGYKTDGEICGLFVKEKGLCEVEKDVQQSVKSEAEISNCIIPVRTLNYSGLWMEGCWEGLVFRVVNQQLNEDRYELAGCVIPNNNFMATEAAKQAGFELVGQYQWWKINF